jgi:hypothetical protein
LLHYIASVWAEQKDDLLKKIDLLILIRREDACDTIEKSIEKIVRDHNIDEYKELKANKAKRIVILVDGFDEMNTNITKELVTVTKRSECNVTFIISTRRHKTEEIVSRSDKELWNVIRCLGISTATDLFATLKLTDGANIDKICSALKKNNLQHNPLFILIAWEVYSKRSSTNDDLDMFTLMNGFYILQFEKYYDVELLDKDKLERFFTTLGWYAVTSEAVEPIRTVGSSFSNRGEFFQTALQRAVEQNKINLMDLEEMFVIGCNVGFLFQENKANGQDMKYYFMHKTVAEFAVAKMLYNTKSWTVADTLQWGKWSMIHYYLLMHSIYTNNEDTELWTHQLNYSIGAENGNKDFF